MRKGLCRFVGSLEALAEYVRGLKQLGCPECEAVQTLNCHSKLYGNDPTAADGRILWGQRVWCCSRGRRGGCGRSFSVFIAEILPRHTLSAALVWRWLIQRLAGLSLKAASEKARLPFALETVYRLRQKLRRQLDRLRERLCREQAPPASAHADPLVQTIAHLKIVFPQSGCAVADFQLRFQRPFLG